MKLLLFALGAWLTGCGLFGLVRGEVVNGGRHNPKRHVSRAAEPVNYWLTTLAYCGFGCVFLWNAFA